MTTTPRPIQNEPFNIEKITSYLEEYADGLDTGWVPLDAAHGFTLANQAAVRLRRGVVYFRGAILRNAGPFTSATEVVATLPDVTFRPSSSAQWTVPSEKTQGTAHGIRVVMTNANSNIALSANTGAEAEIAYLNAIPPYIADGI